VVDDLKKELTDALSELNSKILTDSKDDHTSDWYSSLSPAEFDEFLEENDDKN